MTPGRFSNAVRSAVTTVRSDAREVAAINRSWAPRAHRELRPSGRRRTQRCRTPRMGRAYPQLMRTLTRWRWPLVGAAIIALGAIWLLGPKYTQLQLASDADGFRRIVGDERGRYISAGVADVAFAAFYGLLGLAIARTPLVSRIGAWLVLAGAAFDEAENLLLIANVTAGMNLADERVELMRTAGVAKYIAITAGVVLYVGAWVTERRRRRD